jgi:hypothetical protein
MGRSSLILASRTRERLPVPPLTVEQLEEGLRQLDRGEIEPNLFWDVNIAAFRQTVLLAIRETAHGLSSVHLSSDLRSELESQVEPLGYYLRMADCYLAKRRRRLN